MGGPTGGFCPKEIYKTRGRLKSRRLPRRNDGSGFTARVEKTGMRGEILEGVSVTRKGVGVWRRHERLVNPNLDRLYDQDKTSYRGFCSFRLPEHDSEMSSCERSSP